MGLGAYTIEALSAPYRKAAEAVRIRDEETIKYLARVVGTTGEDEPTYQDLALRLNQLDIFEAVARGVLTSGQGGTILAMRRCAERRALPWYARIVMWLFGACP